MEKLDVLYTANEKFLDIMLASIISLIDNSGISNINVHIIAEEFSDYSYNKINRVISNYPSVKVEFYPFEDFDVSKFNIPKWRGTQVANARIFFQEFMQEKLKDIDNLLYLDSDTIVVDDLNGLSEYQDASIAGVKDLMRKKTLEHLRLPAYYNSGVLYINVNDWLDNSYQEKLIDNIEKERHGLLLPDQDLINITLADEIEALPLEYNFGPIEMIFGPRANKLYFDGKRQVTSEEVMNARRNPKIYHAFGYANIKPWVNNSANPFNEEFMRYILQANPDYERKDIDNIFRIFAFNPWLMKNALLVRNLLPSGLERKLTDVKEKVYLKKNKK